MTQDDALKLALEFIERVNKDGWILADFEPQMYATIAAIKQALAQTHETTLKEFNQQIHDDPNYHIWVKEREDRFKPELDALQVLANENQRMAKRIEELEALAQEQEVGYWKEHAQGMERDYDLLLADYEKLAQRTWVGLEGEEIRNLWEEATDRSTMTMVTSFARTIEAKLKEKNT